MFGVPTGQENTALVIIIIIIFYLKSNIQCILRYEFSGFIMKYTISTEDTHCRNRKIINISNNKRNIECMNEK